MDQQTQRSEKSNNLDHGIVLENPVVSVSEENASCGRENLNGKRIRDPMDEGTSGNSSNSVNAGEIASIREENNDLGIKIDELGQNTCAGRGNGEALPRGSTDGAVLETVILVNSEENQSIHCGLETSKIMVEKSVKNVPEGKKQSCVIDVRCGNGGGGFKDCDGERVCRICHLSSEGLTETKATGFSTELIQLGCGCKDELGIAHAYCAEAWFKLKGNRICEICGEMARNITGVGDNRFMEEWNQRRYVASSISIPSDGSNGCWRGQPFCNFLMACLVVAFVLPWFFRVNMF